MLLLLLLQAIDVVLQMLQWESMVSAHPSLAKDFNGGLDFIPGELLTAMHSVLPCLVSVPEQAQDASLRVCS